MPHTYRKIIISNHKKKSKIRYKINFQYNLKHILIIFILFTIYLSSFLNTKTVIASESPTLITDNATNIEETNATLQGYLQDDGGEPCTVRFEYGTTLCYGTNSTNQTKSTGDIFIANINGLTPGQLYHFRAYANNTVGSNAGLDKTFLTKPDTPTNLNAQTNSSTIIYLTWIKGTGANNTYIERNNTIPEDEDIKILQTVGGGGEAIIGGKYWGAQTFTPASSFYITKVRLYQKRRWNPVGKVNVSIRTTSGGNPTSTVLCWNSSQNASDMSTNYHWRDYAFADPILVESGKRYAIVMAVPSATSGSGLCWHLSYDTNPYTGGDVRRSIDGGRTWNLYQSGRDHLFYVYGRDPFPVPWERGQGTMIYNGTGKNVKDTNLTQNTTYFYQAWSYTNWTNNINLDQYSDSNISANSSTQTYLPIVSTKNATGIEETNATLQGYLQLDGGESCTVRFEYGTTTNYGTNTTNQTKNTGNTFNSNINGLTQGQLYHYRAYVNNTVGSNVGSDKTLLTKPNAPTNLNAQTNSSTTIYITWTRGTGANNTHICRKIGSYPNNITDGTQIYNNTGTSYLDTGLCISTKYYYRAWSYTKWTSSFTTLYQWSDTYDNNTSTTESNNKPTIINPNPSNDSTNVQITPQLNITINDLDGDIMNITWYSNSSGIWIAFGTNTSCGNDTYYQTNSNFSGYGNTYWWNVSVNDGTDTNASAIFHFTTIVGPITVRTNISTGVEESNATLRGYLQDDGGEPCTVRFEYGTTLSYGTNTTNQTKITGETFNANIDGLTQGQLYHYRAYANNSKGSSTGLDKMFLTKPDAPLNLSASAQSASQIDLTWTKGIGANKTHIRRKTGSYPNNVTDGTGVYNNTGTSYSDTGLSASTKYYYRAWSYSEWNYGSTIFYQWSDENNSNFSTTSNSSSSGGGGGGGFVPPPIPPITEDEEEPLTTREQIENLYNISLNQDFYADDSNGDGINDIFTDPNGVLNAEHLVIIDGNVSFLISVNGDLNRIFIWDSVADTITQVTHVNGSITDIVNDTVNNTITVIVTINKDNWVYIEVVDNYPDLIDLTVMSSDGRMISSDMIWRDSSKIFVLDDPAVEYFFIYSYESEGFLFDVILELTDDSVTIGESINALITLINVGEPGSVNGTVIYNLSRDGNIVWSEEEGVSVLGQKAFNKTISTKDLSAGEYTFEVVYSYGDDQIASSSKIFTVNAQLPLDEFPWGIIVAFMVIFISIMIIVFLFKIGYLNFEVNGRKQKNKDTEKANKKTKS